MLLSELIQRLELLHAVHGDQAVLVDTGMSVCVIDEVDLGASDEGVIIWAGDLIEEDPLFKLESH